MSDKTIMQEIEGSLISIIRDGLNNIAAGEYQILLEHPPTRDMGDIAFPMFKFAGQLRMKPFDIAAKLKADIDKSELVAKSEVKGAYLNVFLNQNAVAAKIIGAICDTGDNFGRKPRNGVKMLIEFSSPNTNKPLHLGHCRNNVIGDAISRIYDFCGYDVIKLNLINDRGIHICKSMLAYKLFGNHSTPESVGKKSDHFVGDYYVRFANEAKANPDLENQAQEMLRKWENHDPETLELWKQMNGWAVGGIKETYKRMGIEFSDIEYESNVYMYGKEIIEKGLEKGVFYKEADGSVWINNEDVGLDKKIVLRGDGTSIYITQDIGTATRRHEKYNFSRLMYVVGSEQIYHFKTLFTIFRKLGYDWADNCYHLSYGMVNLPNGRMKSREGTVVDADNLIDLLYDMAMEAINDKQRIADESKKSDIADKISLAALKYYLLNFSTGKDIIFNPEKSLSFDGNTGPYIQYTTARINSLMKKAGTFNVDKDIFADYTFNDDEWAIIAGLLDYEKAVTSACTQNAPIEICSYLYDLAKNFNKFYHDNQILNSDNELAKIVRLQMAKAVLNILTGGLQLLGISPLEEM